MTKNLNEMNGLWKGDNVGYHALHAWVRRHKPKPEFCEKCKKIKPYDLANVSGEYKRDTNDFEWLCRSCHTKFDYNNGTRFKSNLKLRIKAEKSKYQCAICKKYKFVVEFPKQKSRWNGIHSYCIICFNKERQRRRQDNIEKFHKKESIYREKNRKRINKNQRNYYKRKSTTQMTNHNGDGKCLKCRFKIENHNQNKNAIAMSGGNAKKGTASLPSGQSFDSNPQDDSGQARTAAKEDNGDGTFPADYSQDIILEHITKEKTIEACEKFLNENKIGTIELREIEVPKHNNQYWINYWISMNKRLGANHFEPQLIEMKEKIANDNVEYMIDTTDEDFEKWSNNMKLIKQIDNALDSK